MLEDDQDVKFQVNELFKLKNKKPYVFNSAYLIMCHLVQKHYKRNSTHLSCTRKMKKTTKKFTKCT